MVARQQLTFASRALEGFVAGAPGAPRDRGSGRRVRRGLLRAAYPSRPPHPPEAARAAHTSPSTADSARARPLAPNRRPRVRLCTTTPTVRTSVGPIGKYGVAHSAGGSLSFATCAWVACCTQTARRTRARRHWTGRRSTASRTRSTTSTTS